MNDVDYERERERERDHGRLSKQSQKWRTLLMSHAKG